MSKWKFSLGLALACSIGATQAATVVSGDFISTPTHFSGFEDLPWFTTNFTHIEDGIVVSQINPGFDITSVCGIECGMSNGKSWYPNGGDMGYTDVRMESGRKFGNLSMIVGSGFGDQADSIYFELVNQGAVVQTGSVLVPIGSWLGFSGNDFDELRIRNAAPGTIPTSLIGGYNGLVVDSIKVSALPVPEPATYGMLLAGVGLLGVAARRRRD
ncbi:MULTISPECIES: PEP-CTERM sorting domain-containing protein [unclassified Duganella]|nr:MULTISPECIES: PEP-CTERM sorting domain-containing protein [unclassified Duganella]